MSPLVGFRCEASTTTLVGCLNRYLYGSRFGSKEKKRLECLLKTLMTFENEFWVSPADYVTFLPLVPSRRPYPHKSCFSVFRLFCIDWARHALRVIWAGSID